jgi:hypothetical protein
MRSMTNWQLFVSAGLPSLLVLISIWRSDTRMNGIDARMDRIEVRMDRIEARIESTNNLTNSRIDRVADDLTRFYQILGRHEEAIDTLKKK